MSLAGYKKCILLKQKAFLPLMWLFRQMLPAGCQDVALVSLFKVSFCTQCYTERRLKGMALLKDNKINLRKNQAWQRQRETEREMMEEESGGWGAQKRHARREWDSLRSQHRWKQSVSIIDKWPLSSWCSADVPSLVLMCCANGQMACGSTPEMKGFLVQVPNTTTSLWLQLLCPKACHFFL